LHFKVESAYLWKTLYDNGVLFDWEGKTSGIKNFLFDSFISNYDVVTPPSILSEIFNEFVKPFENKKQSNLEENQQLAQLRDWLLPMLMNGQVTVK